MTPLQNALELSMKEENIDLFLPEFFATDFLVMCAIDPEQTDPPIFLTKSPYENELFCITVAESPNAISELYKKPHLAFKHLNGEELLELVRINHEIFIMFDDGQGYCIPRSNIKWWLDNYY